MTWTAEFKGKKGVELLQEDYGVSTVFTEFGTAAWPKLRLNLAPTDIATEPFSNLVRVFLNVGYDTALTAPTNTISAELRLQSDESLIVVSNESYVAADVGASSISPFTFDLNSFQLGYELDEDFRVELKVSASHATPYRVRKNASDVEAQADIERYNGSVWSADTGDLWFRLFSLNSKTFDVATYVKQVKTDRGKSDVDGAYEEGQCEVTLRNHDGRFNPTLVTGPYYEYWDVMAEMTLEVEYDSIVYPIFSGFITRIRPNLEIGQREALVTLSDRFLPFKEHRVSVDMGAARTADWIIGEVMAATRTPASAYNLDTLDTTLLLEKSWADVNALDILEEVVEVGQHHHFVDAAGVYQFYSNFWLGGELPADYQWESGNCPDVNGFQVEYDIKGVLNRVRVLYPGSEYEVSDEGSILKYGQRDLELDNELMPDQFYAEEIARNIFSRSTHRINGANFELKGRFPEVFNTDVGTVIEFTDPFMGLVAEPFIVQGLGLSVGPGDDAELSLRTKRHYSPPYFHEVAAPTAVQSPTIVIGDYFAQQFIVPITGYLSGIQAKIRKNAWAFSHSQFIVFFEDDGADGQGNQLMTVALKLGVTPSPTDEVIDYDMLHISEPAIFKEGVKYWARLFMTSATFEPAKTWQVWGTSGDTEPGLRSGYWNGVAFVLNPTSIDYWLKMKVYPSGG